MVGASFGTRPSALACLLDEAEALRADAALDRRRDRDLSPIGRDSYRLLSGTIGFVDWAFGALVTVMAANVAYNIVLARRRNPRVASTGIIYFLAPLAVLQVALIFADPLSAILNLIYAAWVMRYDVTIMRALWKLNS
jgi:hypothetical protein